MILDIDWGNTRLKWRLSQGATILAANSLTDLEDLALVVRRDKSAGSELESRPQLVRVSSVRSAWDNQRLRQWLEQRWTVPVWFAQPMRRRAGVTVTYSDPTRLGVDRWLGLLAARSRHKAPVVLVQAGTAVVADVLDGAGTHRGGFIGPGWGLMCQSLGAGTAGVQVSPVQKGQASLALGCNTQSAVEGGLVAMMLGLIERARSLAGRDAHLILSGGDGALLAKFLPEAERWPDIVLDGLAVAHRRAG